MWRVIHFNYYDDLFVEVVVGEADNCTEEEAAARFQGTIMVLREDYIQLLAQEGKLITDTDRVLYGFEIVTKETPPPIDPRRLSQKEKLDLLFNPDYMLEEDDFQKVTWTISEAFQWLKNLNPDEDEFLLSSSAYRVEKVEN
ncbi:hypothetical protein NST41_33475 [Paenibacillus sp. FSL L8-0696]|uniref:hypothetical protein n=1 Tax=Paenibacillus sp. FSL L8-0696 TaxID=2954524 RepID=UPI0031197E9A